MEVLEVTKLKHISCLLYYKLVILPKLNEFEGRWNKDQEFTSGFLNQLFIIFQILNNCNVAKGYKLE